MPVYLAVITALEDEVASEETRLVEAKNEARALAHVTKLHVKISKPTSAELVALGKDGVEIETAE